MNDMLFFLEVTWKWSKVELKKYNIDIVFIWSKMEFIMVLYIILLKDPAGLI